MTTFEAKNVFLVFGMGHTMNKLTYECKKMQKLKSLVDLQCKCVMLDFGDQNRDKNKKVP